MAVFWRTSLLCCACICPLVKRHPFNNCLQLLTVPDDDAMQVTHSLDRKDREREMASMLLSALYSEASAGRL